MQWRNRICSVPIELQVTVRNAGMYSLHVDYECHTTVKQTYGQRAGFVGQGIVVVGQLGALRRAGERCCT